MCVCGYGVRDMATNRVRCIHQIRSGAQRQQ